MVLLRVLPEVRFCRKNPSVRTENARERLGRLVVLSQLLNPSIVKIRFRRLHSPVGFSTLCAKELEILLLTYTAQHERRSVGWR